MGKGYFLSKPLALAGIVAAVGAVTTIIALSVVYSKEKAKNKNLPVAATGRMEVLAPPVYATRPTPKEPWHGHRLPGDVKPVNYHVTLRPRLKPNAEGLYIFTGNCTVVFKCITATDLILMHSNKLNLKKFGNHHVTLTGLNGAPKPSIKTTWMEAPTHFVVIQLNSPLKAGGTYEIFTDFEGELSNDLGGFYRSEYEENGVKKVVATTQMQPTDTRKAFPCFDEPKMKAVFHITLIHPAGTVALSNSLSSDPESIKIDGEDWLKTAFDPTLIMSPYLLAFIVSEFAFIKSPKAEDVLVRIWARKKAIEEGQGDYALEKTGSVLSFLEKYYNSSYPLKKSDQIALPDFSAGAMENWGLITYKETSLLYNPAMSSNGDKEEVAKVISHELAHQWFGNLVTMNWWNDLWLNEGFATYVSYLGVDYAEPTWTMKDLIIPNEIQNAMAVDAMVSSHPLSAREEDIKWPEQILQLFDGITYSKGAGVLRMLSEFITEKAFSRGLHTYLEEFKHSNTVYHDLWKNLQKAVDEAGIKLPASIEVIMNRWILQMGFPVVTVNTQTGQIKQKHFLTDPKAVVERPSEFNYEWIVPVTWIKKGGDEQMYWLTEKEGTNPDMKTGSNEWLLANINMKGFFRVNYDLQNWENLIAKLNSKHEDIPVINRAQIMDDAFNLARAKYLDITLALSTTRYLDKEVEHLPWSAGTGGLSYIILMFDRSEVYGPIRAYLRKQVAPLFRHFKRITDNWNKIPERHTDQYNQVTAISLACGTDVEGCRDLVIGWFREWMADPDNNKIHPNFRSTVYCRAIASGGAEEWDFAWDMMKKATIASEVSKLMSALACTKQPWLISRYLHYTLDPEKIRMQDVPAVIGNVASNSVGQPLAWDFIRSKWEKFSELGGGAFFLSSLLGGLTSRFSSEFEYKQLKQFKDENAAKLGPATMTVLQAMEVTKANMDWVAENRQNVYDWFLKETSSSR